MVSAFQNLLIESGNWCPSLIGLDFERIGDEDATRLEEAFSMEEVFSAFLELNEDKAPGLDGFSVAFWQFSREFVKDEVMGFFKEFHE